MSALRKYVCNAVLPVILIVLVLVSCDQRPLDLAPESPNVTWTTLHQFNYPRQFTSVWGSSPNDVYFGTGDTYREGVIFHLDGVVWEKIPFQGSERRFDLQIWGTGPDNIYVADSGLYRFDGDTWSKQSVTAEVVGGTAPDNVFAADGNNIYYFNGSYWELLHEMEERRRAYAIWVGPGRSLALARPPEVVHWDGTRWWTTKPKGAPVDIWGTAPDDLYLVDFYPGSVGHYDGNDWSQMDFPDDDNPSLSSIWGFARDDMYAVGNHGEIFHYDGNNWSVVEHSTQRQLNDIWGAGATDIYMVGDYEKVIHYNGSSWSSVRGDIPWVPRVAWAESKTRLAVASPETGVSLYDGNSWRESFCGTNSSVSAFGGTALNDLYISLYDGTIRHFDGSNWSVSADSVYGHPRAFWTAGPGDIFSVGRDAIYHFDGIGWDVMVDDPDFFNTGYFRLIDIWGSSPENVFAVGYGWGGGVIVRYDGTNWTLMDCETKEILLSVWGRSEDDVFAVGYGGIYHYDGDSWVSQPHYYQAGARWVTGRAPNLVIAGSYDYLLRYDGVIWNYQKMNELTENVFDAYDGSIIRLTTHGISYCEE